VPKGTEVMLMAKKSSQNLVVASYEVIMSVENSVNAKFSKIPLFCLLRDIFGLYQLILSRCHKAIVRLVLG